MRESVTSQLDDVVFDECKNAIVDVCVHLSNSGEIAECRQNRDVVSKEKTRKARRLTSRP
jgi:hypothetical protein